jgi:hypothetical protein
VEPPSESLERFLVECGLCQRGELRRCRGRVRRLVHDLPAFDSVWIDALLQARVLTGYQARVLSSSDPTRLRVGPCVLVERLGGGRWSETCVAELIGSGGERRVLKRLVVPSDILESVTSRMAELVEAAATVDHPGIVAPAFVERQGRELIVGSRHIDGPSLRELLVRRGRFPAEVVQEIAAGLVEALSELEAAGLVHGGLMPGNVRLSSNGQAVAVDAGVTGALEPRLVVDVTRPPDRYDGIAPEIAADSGSADSRSDMYALGCLLFELLAGRPPFPVADAVMKLNAHQAARVADVRDWSPDVPAGLAERVHRLCAYSQADRPESWREAREEWRTARARKTRHSKTFLRQMRSAAPVVHVAGRRDASGVLRLVGGTVLAIGLAAVVWVSQQWSTSNRPPGVVAAARAAVAPAEDVVKGTVVPELIVIGRGVWPERSKDGTVRLVGSDAWSGVRLEDSESLVLIGVTDSDGSRARIVIEAGRPLELYAARVELHGLDIRGPSAQPWVIVHGGVLRVSDCRFVGDADQQASGTSLGVEVVEGAEQGGVYVEWQRVVVTGLSTGMRIRASRAEVVGEDVLQVGGETWLDWQRPQAISESSLGVVLRHCTLRQSRRLLKFGGGRVRIDTESCVLAIPSGEVLCESRVESTGLMAIRGRATLLTPGTVVTRGGGDVEGLVAAVPTFGGPGSADPRDSELSRLPAGVPAVDGTRPGIRAMSAR